MPASAKPPRVMSRAEHGPPRLKQSFGEWVGQRIGLSGDTARRFWGSAFGSHSEAGETVTTQRAMQLSTIFSGTRLTASTIASLPVNLQSVTAKGPVVETGTPTDTLIRLTPNDEDTPMEFWEGMIASMELQGDGLARKMMVGARTVAMMPMDAERSRIIPTAQGGYEWRTIDRTGKELILQPAEVFQIKNFGINGRRGMSTVSYGAQTMGLAIAAEKAAGRLFKSGLRSSGFIQTQGVMEEPDRRRLQTIIDQYVGSDKAGGIMLLEGGMDFKPLSMNAADAELLLTRKFQIEELCRWLGMPPILVGHSSDGQTMWGTGVDAIVQSWITLGLAFRLIRIEQAIWKRLMSPAERAELTANYDVDALLRVNSVARAQFLATMVQGSLLTPDEGRAASGRGALPGGDQLLAQVNLVPLAQLGQNSTDPATTAKAAFRGWLGIQEPPANDPPRPAA